MKVDGMDLLTKAFDDQWKIINKRRQDYGNLFEENFFLFIDECINYFFNILIPFLDGTLLNMTDSSGRTYTSSIFTTGYFETKKSKFNDLLNDLIIYRTNNPSSIITREEARKIMSGQLSTMADINNFLNRIGDLFYDIASELHRLERLHSEWIKQDKPKQKFPVYKPITKNAIPIEEETNTSFRPFPFYDCRIRKGENNSPYINLFKDKVILGDSIKESVIKFIIAFSYQTAYECYNETLYNELAHRKDIKNKIKELIGRI